MRNLSFREIRSGFEKLKSKRAVSVEIKAQRAAMICVARGADCFGCSPFWQESNEEEV